MNEEQILAFIRESNRIEGILREPTTAEIVEFVRFMGLKKLTLLDVVHFVSVYQPDAELRDRRGLNVQVGAHIAPSGGVDIKLRLEDILDDANGFPHQAFGLHQRYEYLHPFTDGNGRSGRMIWMWMMKKAPLGFLHHWYYQSLENSRDKK